MGTPKHGPNWPGQATVWPKQPAPMQVATPAPTVTFEDTVWVYDAKANKPVSIPAENHAELDRRLRGTPVTTEEHPHPYGRGYAYVLSNIIMMAPTLEEMTQNPAPLGPREWYMRMYGAITRIEYPENLPLAQQERINRWRATMLASYEERGYVSWEEIVRNVERAKELLLDWDLQNGVEAKQEAPRRGLTTTILRSS